MKPREEATGKSEQSTAVNKGGEQGIHNFEKKHAIAEEFSSGSEILLKGAISLKKTTS